MDEQVRRLFAFIYFSTSASVPLCLVTCLRVQRGRIFGFKGHFNRQQRTVNFLVLLSNLPAFPPEYTG